MGSLTSAELLTPMPTQRHHLKVYSSKHGQTNVSYLCKIILMYASEIMMVICTKLKALIIRGAVRES